MPMKNTDFYFDYICPFCYQSFKELSEYKLLHPELTIEYHPFEIHPRPESFGKHTDLCIRGMFLAKELGVDLWAYNTAILNARFQQRADIENIDVLSDIVKDLIDPQVFRNTIRSGQYQNNLDNANQTAYHTLRIMVVPHYITENKVLESIEGIGISKEALFQFLDSNTH